MRHRRLLVQVGVAAVLLVLLALLVNNLAVNLIRTGLGLGFGWLGRPAGFALAETALPYSPSDSYLWALTVGWLNSLKVIVAGLVLATVLGVAAGAARSSGHRLLRSLAGQWVKRHMLESATFHLTYSVPGSWLVLSKMVAPRSTSCSEGAVGGGLCSVCPQGLAEVPFHSLLSPQSGTRPAPVREYRHQKQDIVRIGGMRAGCKQNIGMI